MSDERPGRVWFNGWAGLTSARVMVIGETPKRYRVRFVDAKKPAGMWACRTAADPGEVRLVPKFSVSFDEDTSPPIRRKEQR